MTFVALVAVTSLAACSKQAPAPAPAAQGDDPEEREPPAAVVEQPAPAIDYAKQADGMMMLLADAPECQAWRDELQAIAHAPAGVKPAREPALVVAAAHEAKCSKKSRGQ